MTCECRCGYTCGGPGKCALSPLKCLEAGHWVRDCDHTWDGEGIGYESPMGGFVHTATCSRCGMHAIDHDSVNGP